MFKIISLSALILLLVACGSPNTDPKTTTNEPAKTDVVAQPNALDKAKEVQGVVDNKAKETDKAQP